MINIPNEVKDLLKNEGTRRNFRVHFPNGERADITNENIISESVTLTESLCSQNQLKYGLCESPVLEFETFGIGKIKGYTIEASLEVDAKDLRTTDSIQKYFDISGRFLKIDASQLHYLPIGTRIEFHSDVKVSNVDVVYRDGANDNFGFEDFDGVMNIIDFEDNGEFPQYINFEMNTERISEGDGITIILNNTFPEYVEYKDDTEMFSASVPYGIFIVESCKKQDNMARRRVVAYATNRLEYPQMFIDSVNSLTFSKNKCLSFDAIKTVLGITPGNQCRWLATDDMYINFIGETSDGIFSSYRVHFEEITLTDDGLTACYIDTNFEESTRNFIRKTVQEEMKKGVDKIQVHNDDESVENYKKIPSYYAPKTLKDIFRNIYAYAANGYHVFYVPARIRVNGGEWTTLDKVMRCYRVALLDDIGANLNMYEVTNGYRAMLENNANSALPAFLELQGKFGILSKDGGLNLKSLQDTFDFPYLLIKNDYQKLWYDDDYSKPIGRITCTYTNKNGETVSAVRDIVEDYNTEFYKSYSIDKNNMISKFTYDESDIEEIFDEMEMNIKNISYMPTELVSVGIPWLEPGDFISVESDEGFLKMLVEKRVLSGINSLTDTIICTDEIDSTSASVYTYNADTKTLVIE